ncbi:uncharacterized protein LOC134315227 [Trichomycterus rosablanca]|uniref:uncharacterized protein LOC134315227 n=1 Tax=Trichomycterus rosablanca TaxID=2290929 RepID=UPI002F35ED6B
MRDTYTLKNIQKPKERHYQPFLSTQRLNSLPKILEENRSKGMSAPTCSFLLNAKKSRLNDASQTPEAFPKLSVNGVSVLLSGEKRSVRNKKALPMSTKSTLPRVSGSVHNTAPAPEISELEIKNEQEQPSAVNMKRGKYIKASVKLPQVLQTSLSSRGPLIVESLSFTPRPSVSQRPQGCTRLGSERDADMTIRGFIQRFNRRVLTCTAQIL